VILLQQLKLTKFKLEVFKLNFQRKKKDMNRDKLVTGKISLKFDFSSSLITRHYGKIQLTSMIAH